MRDRVAIKARREDNEVNMVKGSEFGVSWFGGEVE